MQSYHTSQNQSVPPQVGKNHSPRKNIFTYKVVSVYYFYGPRSKNLAAFMCLPKKLIPQEATSWLPTLLSKLRTLSGCPSPNTGGSLQKGKGNYRFTGLYTSHWSGQESQSIPEVTCPSHLPWVLLAERAKLKPCKRLLIYSRKSIQVTVTKG